MICGCIYKNGQSRLWLALPLFFCIGIAANQKAGINSEFDTVFTDCGMEQMYGAADGIVDKADMYGETLRLTIKKVYVSDENGTYECGNILVYTDAEEADIIPGDRISASGNIDRIVKAANPGQFDLRAYYEAMNIKYSMQADEIKSVHKNSLTSALFRLKILLQNKLSDFTGNEDYEILSAMLLGDKSELNSDIKYLYQISGIAHILTISGLHISIIGRGLYRILKRCGMGFTASAVLSGTVMVLYLIMSGAGISSVRAVIMFIILLLGECLGKSYDMPSSVSLAGIILLISYPLMLYQFAFQMSVICIFSISYVSPTVCRFLRIENNNMKTVVTGILIQWTSLPVMLYHMYTYPVLSVFLNFLVVPLAGMVMLSGILGIAVSFVSIRGAEFAVATAHFILLFYKKLCGITMMSENFLIVRGRPEIRQVAIYYVLAFSALFYMAKKADSEKGMTEKEGVRLKRLIPVTLIIFFTVILMFVKCDRKLTVTFADVGQGDSILINKPDTFSALIDCGSSNIQDVSGQRIVPMLNYYGIKRLDYMFLSHSDSDHINGAAELISLKRVKKIILPVNDDNGGFDEIIQTAKMFDTEIIYINAGQKLVCGDMTFICLNPDKNPRTDNLNRESMVLKFSYKKFSIMFTGDIDTEGEKHVIENAELFGIEPDCNILKAGHHGSGYSSGEEFIHKIKPEETVISCSENNRYGHPAPDTISRLNLAGSKIYITKDSGAVIYRADGNGYITEEFKN